MQKLDNKPNPSITRMVFMMLQIIVLAVVYLFVYSSFKAIQYAIEKFDISMIMYFPVFLVMVISPILLYKYRQMFHGGKMLVATVWTMGTASLMLLLLSVYIVGVTN